MRSSCICHPSNQPLLIIRKWQLEFCDGNHCAAALLSFFEYWHNVKLATSERARQANERARERGQPATHDESLLQFHTDEDLRVGLLGLYGTMKIRASRRLLIEKEALSEHPNPAPRYAFDKTLYYLFHDEAVNAWLERRNEGAPIAKNGERVAKNGERVAKNGERVAKNGDGSAEKPIAIKVFGRPALQTTTETTSETTTTTHVPAAAVAEPAQHDGHTQRSSSSGELIFDHNLAATTPAQQRRVAKILSRLETETAQQVLDELNDALGRGNIKNRWGWLAKVAQCAQAGTFAPTSDLAERRQKQIAAAAVQPPPRTPSAVWQAHLEELQAALKGGQMALYLATLRGVEDGATLWLEAPNPYIADEVRAQMPRIEPILRPHTALPIRVCLG